MEDKNMLMLELRDFDQCAIAWISVPREREDGEYGSFFLTDEWGDRRMNSEGQFGCPSFGCRNHFASVRVVSK